MKEPVLFLSYYLIHAGSSGVGLVINLIVYLIIAVILFYIFQLAASYFGIPATIVKLVGLLLFLLLVLSLFAGCGAYESSVASRTVGVSGYAKDTNAVGGQVYDSVQYR